jgi:four helix bundle protein
MGLAFEDLEILQIAEGIADAIWQEVEQWEPFAQDTIGKQIVRAADSIGANIAEAFGRYHYGEKLRFFYYARGSIFEMKYWLNRVLARELMSSTQGQQQIATITQLARKLNNTIKGTKTQQTKHRSGTNMVKETAVAYQPDPETHTDLFDQNDLNYLQS